MAKKICLYCGLQLPDTTKFCPECGRTIEDDIRVERGVTIRRTPITKGCLHCGLQLPDSASFCPECGRPIEKGQEIRPVQKSEFDCPREEIEKKDDPMRQQGFYDNCSGPLIPLDEVAQPV